MDFSLSLTHTHTHTHTQRHIHLNRLESVGCQLWHSQTHLSPKVDVTLLWLSAPLPSNMTNTACPSECCYSIPFYVAVSIFSTVLLHLYFLWLIAEVTAGVSAACFCTLLEWRLQGSTKVTKVLFWKTWKPPCAAGQTHTLRRSKVTQH